MALWREAVLFVCRAQTALDFAREVVELQGARLVPSGLSPLRLIGAVATARDLVVADGLADPHREFRRHSIIEVTTSNAGLGSRPDQAMTACRTSRCKRVIVATFAAPTTVLCLTRLGDRRRFPARSEVSVLSDDGTGVRDAVLAAVLLHRQERCQGRSRCIARHHQARRVPIPWSARYWMADFW